MRVFWLIGLLAGCKAEPEPSPLLEVEQTEQWQIPGMIHDAYVVRTEGNVPHLYATNRQDLARLAGFVQARDRFFVLDMTRRLGLGEVSGLLGDAALASDMEARASGMTFIADKLLADMDPDRLALFTAYAHGVNAYIAAVKAEELPPPSEFVLAAPLLGVEDPTDLMVAFDERSLAGITATVLYQLGYETGDVGRARTEAVLDGLFEGAALGDLRRAGARVDLWERIVPVHPESSAPDWVAAGPESRRARRPGPHVPATLFEEVLDRQATLQRLLGHDWDEGFGSNAWAVAGSATSGGRSLLAGDGHLPLSVPALFYQMGFDTAHLGGGDTHQIGLVIPGMPMMAVGTNGHVAWSQTQLMGDITDWYVEEIRLDESGQPAESLFQGEWRPLQRFEETFTIAEVALLGSEGRTETRSRWVTFDGRWISSIEGTPGAEGDLPTLGGWIVPGDTDEDGRITAISFDYTGLDTVDLLGPVDRFGHARDVHEFAEATRDLVAYSQNLTVADAGGSILYTGFQAVPCRGYLDRDEGGWAAGADPSRLLDGTRYGGFTIPMAGSAVDYSQGDDPARCVIPMEEYPHAFDPPQGFVQTANNDPGGLSFDNDLSNDGWYIGGPWDVGYRADRIATLLEEAIAAGEADLDAMARIQGDHHSVLGEQLVPELLDAIAAAREADGRLGALYDADAATLDEVEARLAAWLEADLPARSGIETFYAPAEDGDVAHAAATTIFNAWLGHYMRRVFDDEGLPGVWGPTGSSGRMRGLTTLLDGRGPDDPLGLASWNPETGESAFFDILGTPETETSHEVALLALDDALTFLQSPETAPGRGGFGTPDMDAWLWGLRHWVHFDSLLAGYVGDEFSFFTEPFAITPEILPMGGELDALPGFPRHGDNLIVDAGNFGFSGTSFDYDYGPTFRMVIALGPDGVEGRNVIPGGQSGLNDSPFFADQAALWLGNDTLPMRFTVAEVVQGATGRETFVADDSWWRE